MAIVVCGGIRTVPQQIASSATANVMDAATAQAGRSERHVTSAGTSPEALACARAAVACVITGTAPGRCRRRVRSEEHTSELQSLMRISYAVFCLKTTTT